MNIFETSDQNNGSNFSEITVASYVNAINLIPQVKPKKELLFIDGNVDNYQSLASGARPGTEVFILDSARDGVEQISEVLASRSDIKSVHIVSHGGSGNLQLGATRLNSETLNTYSEQLQQWGNSLTYLLLMPIF
ncbi:MULTISPECIES: DUF4347 domain-containing protein [unclassified Microcoleus]|uniref:DUF4347 domain-containing protein n=1 Tax=unclassified Microcoleus TaxID=2642155 RepID=UPI0025F3A626|nr:MULTISPECIES: DUF4347 domain-containing protein [unclassified Microcoleus]